MIDTAAYLHRIQCKGTTSPSLETLANLQRQHLITIPFENLDIYRGVEIRLDIERIFTKVIEKSRGGFCYELNELFHQLLANLGFEVERISARVFGETGVMGPEFDHLVNKVEIDGEYWLTDVGFGEFPLHPIPLKDGAQVEDRNQIYRLEQLDSVHWLLKKSDSGGPFDNKYQFTLQSREYHEYESMCHYMQTDPDSHFVKKRICTIATPTGRITLGKRNLILVEGDEKRQIPVENEADYHKKLLTYFQIKL